MASANLLSPPSQIPPSTALALSQKAPLILSTNPTSSLPWPLSLLFSRETPESWAIHENLLLSSLRTGDEASASQLLQRLESRFGEHNERIVTLRGIYNEATAQTTQDLEKVFDGYEKILREDPTNTSIRKRRVAVLKSLGRTQDAMTAITVLLQHSPTDVEAWAEASELYAAQAAWGQAIYCAEEVLLSAPLSWSAHAHVATLHHLSAVAANNPPSLPSLSLSLKHFCRAVELNENYLRGYYGIKTLAAKLVPLLSSSTPPSSSLSAKKRTDQDAAATDDDIPVPSLSAVQALDALATQKLGDMIRDFGSRKKGGSGYDEAEVIAARELLDREGGR
ncbi:Inositol phosphatase SIW14 [Neodidymelliopsis sp. IMI 364377]|nr:Inositol phosphatase SIW14 [Neodidymelliopsis sp. IMI 364377]